MALWGGRFKSQLDESAKNFNDSFSFDQRLYKQDITGSIAHAKMLAKQNIITESEGELIVKTLEDILSSIENGKIDFNTDAEDIHSFVESLLIEKIGDIGKKLHTGRSRNDQVALDMKLYVRDNIDTMLHTLDLLLMTIDDIIEQNKNTYMSYDYPIKNNDFNDKNLDLLKDIQELMEHGDLNLYQILSDFKSKEKSDSINIQDIPQALKIASIDTNVDEVNNLLDILLMPKKHLVNINIYCNIIS